jgi:hypothetical protein
MLSASSPAQMIYEKEHFAVWFNPRSGKTRKGELHITVHSMPELTEFFASSTGRISQMIKPS